MACRTCKDGVILMPFSHQVGGHAGMLKYNDATVCKPLKQRELLFYQSLPHEMVQFTPEFRGTVDVCIEDQQDGTLCLRAYPCFQMASRGRCSPNSSGEGVDSDEETEETPCCSSCSSPSSSRKHHHKSTCSSPPSSRKHHRSPPSSRKHNHKSTCSSPSSSRKHHQKSHYHTPHKRNSSCTVWSCNGCVCLDEDKVPDDVFEDHSNGSSKPTPCNPWGLHCHQKQVAKMRRDQKNHKFILLDNVTSQFQYPCVLDLKMGTRSYGDDFTEEKRKSHIAKAESTTSATLGMRICGMQVYNPDTGKFVCRNKYYGRRLSKDGLMKGLRDFLHNGHRVRTELISQIIRKLQKLIDIVSQQNCLRLYSSSLLIMYEGHREVKGHKEVKDHREVKGHREEESKIRDDEDQSKDAEQDVTQNDPRSTFDPKTCVDVKMIDFANTCHKGQKTGTNTPFHNGPDKGFMYGLENLVQMLNNLTSKSERLKDAASKSERLKDATSKSERLKDACCSGTSNTTLAAGVSM